MCDGCWNVERYIEDYLKKNEGKKRMINFIEESIKKDNIKKITKKRIIETLKQLKVLIK